MKRFHTPKFIGIFIHLIDHSIKHIVNGYNANDMVIFINDGHREKIMALEKARNIFMMCEGRYCNGRVMGRDIKNFFIR